VGYTVDADQSVGAVVIKDQTYGPTVVTATVVDALATEPKAGQSVDKGAIRVSRTGSCHTALTVKCTLGGTAANGVDYFRLTVPVTLAVGQGSKTLTVVPIADSVADPNETVVLTVQSDAAYSIGSGQETATVTIRE
jgi:glycine/D-amino acid oxidase-like deaminating enzyme